MAVARKLTNGSNAINERNARPRYHLEKESPMYRISLLLWLIARAALNLTLLKYSEAVINLSPKFAGLIGLSPLFDLFALSLYLALTRRFRFALVRREMRKNFVDSAAMVSGAILVLGTMSCLLFPEVVLQLADLLLSPFHQWIQMSDSSPETRGFLLGTLLVMVISGPLILLTFVAGYIHSRYRLEITRREGARVPYPPHEDQSRKR
jgi:hypothetical protein